MSEGTRAAAGLLTLAACCVGTAHAGDVDFRPMLSLGEIFSDNIRLQPDKESDAVTEVRPGFSLTSKGGGLDLSLDYELQGLLYARDSDLSGINNRLNLNGTAELVDQRLFVDAHASYYQQATTSSPGVSSDDALLSGDYADVGTFRISPRWQERFGGWAESRLVFDYGQTRYIDSPTDTSATGTGNISNSDFYGVSAQIDSGRRFTRLGWGLSFNDQRSSFSEHQPGTDDQDRQRNAAANLRWGLSEDWSLLARAGREDNDVQDQSADQPNGSYWSVGAGWTPSRYLDLSVYAGPKDKEARLELHPTERTTFTLARTDRSVGLVTGPSWAMEFEHRSRYSRWGASYSEEVTNEQQLAFSGQNFIPFVNVSTGQVFYFDPVSGRLLSRDEAFTLRNGNFTRKRFELSSSYERGRSQLFGRAFSERREFLDQSGDEKALGADLTWTWRFAPRTRSIVGAIWERSRGEEDDSTTDYYAGRLGLSHQLAADADGLLEFSHTNSSDDGSGSSSSTGSYDENRITMSVNMRF